MRLQNLGYAVTVHSAQGITVDVTHGVLTGSESRQQLYVMMTRGRDANHVYVPIVGDGDEHTLLHPTTLRPETAVDVLETILFRDGSARSATTEVREATAPATMLTNASARYLDTLHVAAESILDPGVLRALDRGADGVVKGLTGCPAWPTLRAALILNALDGSNPIDDLRAAAAADGLDSAHDPAAVLTWRLPHRSAPGPLPWLPPIPDTLASHSGWNPYLADRTALVARCAQELRRKPQALERPAWALPGQQLTPALISDVEVWRAAVGVHPSDRRPTGPVQLGEAARTWQKHLDTRLRSDVSQICADKLADIHPRIHDDPFTVTLTHHIATLHANGVAVRELLARTATDGPLPAEHAAAALWWRLSRQLDQSDHTGSVASTPTEVAALVGATKNMDHDSAATGEQEPRLPLDLISASTSPKEAEVNHVTRERREQRRGATGPNGTPISPWNHDAGRALELQRLADHSRRPPPGGPSR